MMESSEESVSHKAAMGNPNFPKATLTAAGMSVM
jgi:hypothetical protein